MKYEVHIEETVCESFAVEASSEAEAMEIAQRKYEAGEFVLESVNVTARCMSVDGACWRDF